MDSEKLDWDLIRESIGERKFSSLIAHMPIRPELQILSNVTNGIEYPRTPVVIKSELELFKEGLRTITVLGHKLYVNEWTGHIAETYLVPNELWDKITPELQNFNEVIDAYVDNSTTPRKVKIARQRKPMGIFPLGPDRELGDFKYAKKSIYIYFMPS